jgi:hypothetical protein
MGTSKGYDAPTSPQWRELKTTVTKSANSGATGGIAEKVVSKYINATRSNDIAHPSSPYSAAISAGRMLVPFFYSVSVNGLSKTLDNIGIGNLSGKTITEIKLILMDYFCSSSSSLQDIDARKAFSDLFDELFEDANDYTDIERILSEKLSNDEWLMYFASFLGHFVFQSFCRTFYEKLLKKAGEEKASNYLNDIKDYIFARITALRQNRDIADIDWAGAEGKQIIVNICNDVLDIFGGE